LKLRKGNQQIYILIGSGGFLGRALANSLRSQNTKFYTASHSSISDFRIDLTKPFDSFIAKLPDKITHGIICSAIATIDICKSDYKASYEFNVTRTIEMIEQFQNKGITPLFCSSDMVFDGTLGNYKETDDRFPSTAYGEMKKIVEDYLFDSNKPFLIVRLTKLYSRDHKDTSFIQEIKTKLASGQIVSAAYDQFVNMIEVKEAASVITLLLQQKHSGVFHIAGSETLTRYAIACRIATPINALDQIKKCSIEDFNFKEPRPKNNTLNTDKIRKELNIEFSKF